MRLGREFFARDPVVCARELIGARFSWGECAGLVVETEAYAAEGDEACHTFFRPSAREFVASFDAGAAYVYFNYGMYWLTNVLIKGGDRDGFVLLRALRPERGMEVMRARRGREGDRELCSGPGKLSVALGIDGNAHGSSFVSGKAGGFELAESLPSRVVTDRRVGISKATDLEWRFLAEGSEYVSVPPGRGGARKTKKKRPPRSRRPFRDK